MFRYNFLHSFLIILFLIPFCIGCGHTSSDKKAYAETISMEEWDPNVEIFAEKIDDEDSENDEVAPTDSSENMQPDSISSSPESADVQIEDLIAQEENQSLIGRNPGNKRIKVNFNGRLADVFNDSNHLHLGHAERMGIAPIYDIRSLYRTRRPIVKVETNKDFRIDKLTHSLPFLVPEAETLLHDIGRAFHDTVAARKGGDYRIIVTSVLRTPCSVKRLTRINRNAVSQSTHQYATTFDITYTRFESLGKSDETSPEDLKNILGEILHRLRAEGRCMVKYERKSPCFHITVAR